MTAQSRRCMACGGVLPATPQGRLMFCPTKCAPRKRPAPAVYRFVCPDGRCYVGHTANHHKRDRRGLERSNLWIDEALLTYPPETWTYEVLEKLPPGCSKKTLCHVEQQHIERLRSWMPEHGFNIHPAWWFGTTPGVLAGRVRSAEQTRKTMRRSWSLRRGSTMAGR